MTACFQLTSHFSYIYTVNVLTSPSTTGVWNQKRSPWKIKLVVSAERSSEENNTPWQRQNRGFLQNRFFFKGKCFALLWAHFLSGCIKLPLPLLKLQTRPPLTKIQTLVWWGLLEWCRRKVHCSYEGLKMPFKYQTRAYKQCHTCLSPPWPHGGTVCTCFKRQRRTSKFKLSFKAEKKVNMTAVSGRRSLLLLTI